MTASTIRFKESTVLDPQRLPGPVWVVAPHPDDEALGCGGLLSALSELGREIHALLMTDGGASHPNSARFPGPILAQQRLGEWRSGLGALGVAAQQSVSLGLADGDLIRCSPLSVRHAIEQAWAPTSPATLLLPWRRDPHTDHRACWLHFEPLLAQVPYVLEYTVWLPERSQPADWPRPEEQLSELFFQPTTSQQDRKAAAIAMHRSQLGMIDDDPFGFVLPDDMVQRAVKEPERFFVSSTVAHVLTAP